MATLDYNEFIGKRGKGWKPSAIRGLYPLEKLPGMISMLAGKPNSDTFPFESITVALKPVIPGDPSTKIGINGDALTEGLQYGPTAGLNNLNAWLTDLQKRRHNRVQDGWRVTIGSGSQDLIAKTMWCMLDDGDSIILETPVYPGVLGVLAPLEVNLIESPVDGLGLDPVALENILTNFSTLHPGKKFPRLLYTIPTGSNPSGCTSPLERRIEVLRIARKFNLLLLEDSAYDFLFYTPEQRQPSYFELDGRDAGEPRRVIRFDSFSKIFSSGMRLGFCTAPAAIADVIDLNTSNTNLQPSSLSQSVIFAVLREWGYDGFVSHCERVGAFYKGRCDMFEAAARRHLDGLVSWVTPTSGMFLYLKLHINKDGTDGDSEELIKTKAVQKGFLGIPGVQFLPSGQTSPYVRVSFSQISDDNADEAFRRLRELMLEVRGEL